MTSTRGCSQVPRTRTLIGGAAVEERVGDQLGDAELGALDEVGAVDVVAGVDHPAACFLHAARARAQGEGRPIERHGRFSKRSDRAQGQSRLAYPLWQFRQTTCPDFRAQRGLANNEIASSVPRVRNNGSADRAVLYSGTDWRHGPVRQQNGAHGSRRRQQSNRHRVVVVGSGFGGLFGTKALRRADVDVTMVAKTTHHLFQPLLYQVATGILSEGEIAPPTREVLSGQKNAQVLLGEVTDIDLEKREVTSQVLGRPTVTPYDSLIVAAGAAQSYFGNDHFAEFAPGHEEHRRRPRAARPDLRRLRDGRARRHPRRQRRPPADLRGRRRRPDRRGDGRADRRARAPHARAATSARSTPAPPG